MKKIFVLIISILSQPALSGSITGTIDNLLVGRNSSELYIKVNAEHVSSPCSSVHPTGYQFGADLEALNPAVFSTLLAAHASQSIVKLQGSGTCLSIDSRLENLSYVVIH